jgi:hypothetical protein
MSSLVGRNGKINRRKNYIEKTMETRKKPRKKPCKKGTDNLRGICFSFVSER